MTPNIGGDAQKKRGAQLINWTMAFPRRQCWTSPSRMSDWLRSHK